jgi:SnoaL-like domain
MTDTRDAAANWAATWKRCWEGLERDPIVALYADAITYSSEPYREPYRGRDGVRAYLDGSFGDESEVRAWFGEPVVDGDRAAVSWWATLRESGEPITLAGTSVLRFDADGLAVDQWDAWNQLDGWREPPDGWGR